jgi:two-component system sensor histidine kinase DesK
MHDDLGAGIYALKLHAEFLKQKVEDGELKNDIDELLKLLKKRISLCGRCFGA